MTGREERDGLLAELEGLIIAREKLLDISNEEAALDVARSRKLFELDKAHMLLTDKMADELDSIASAELYFAPNHSAVYINGTKHPLTPRLSNLCKWAKGREAFEFWDIPEDIRGNAGRLVKMFQNQYAPLCSLLFDNMGGQQIRPRF